jgi:hypothetical protein
MASVLESVAFDPAVFLNELNKYEQLLKSKKDLSERDDIIPCFKKNKHLSAYIGALYLEIEVGTEVCAEFDISGKLRADLLVGSKAKRKFCIIEFESGEEGTIFKKQNRKNPEYAPRFEHAFSQIVTGFVG